MVLSPGMAGGLDHSPGAVQAFPPSQSNNQAPRNSSQISPPANKIRSQYFVCAASVPLSVLRDTLHAAAVIDLRKYPAQDSMLSPCLRRALLVRDDDDERRERCWASASNAASSEAQRRAGGDHVWAWALGPCVSRWVSSLGARSPFSPSPSAEHPNFATTPAGGHTIPQSRLTCAPNAPSHLRCLQRKSTLAIGLDPLVILLHPRVSAQCACDKFLNFCTIHPKSSLVSREQRTGYYQFDSNL
ncbi:hypothetical protein K466DRAFT_145531 [Polyporus arcularius HHB13444]|uniref:Uncharacterized protein n=1 Tax=Polyporus arcularius HHB13444 TaxID=1314778 RepID=A0A5C3Q432_9APHY|nr:hypothetical protein K466DRAFT_145531 [Polyporus arcularius HHB13444]